MHLESIDWYVFEENIPEWMKRNAELTAMEIAVYTDNQIRYASRAQIRKHGIPWGMGCTACPLKPFIKLGDIMKDFIGSLLLFATAYVVLWLAMAIY